ncbi:AEC family transporter [Fusobacterium necrophorum subsp. funduliforme]
MISRTAFTTWAIVRHSSFRMISNLDFRSVNNLSMIPFREVFSETKLYLFSFFRLLAFPLILWFLLKGFMANTDFLIVVLVTAAMPGAAMMVNLATEYKGNVYFASKYLVLSTLLSVIIVPVVIYVLQNYV